MNTSSKLVLLAAALVAMGVSQVSAPSATAQDPPRAPAASFVGSKSCKKCHIKEHRSWERTDKSHALQLLAPGERAEAKRAAQLDPAVDYRQDASCLECHVVGAGQPGGFTAAHIVADPEQLGGIGCESCHGPGGGYLREGLHDKNYKGAAKAQRLPAQLEAGFVPLPAEQSCRHCHDPERSRTVKPFDYAARKDDPKGLHDRPAGR